MTAADSDQLSERFLRFRSSPNSYLIGICPLREGQLNRSFVADLGAALAETLRRRVLLVSLDKNDHQLERYSGVPESPGLDEMLQTPPDNRLDTIYPSRFPRVSVLPAGGKHQPLEPDTRWQRIDWLRNIVSPHFEAVVIEYPGLDTNAVPPEAYSAADATFLAVPTGSAANEVRRGIDALRRSGANLAGTILAH